MQSSYTKIGLALTLLAGALATTAARAAQDGRMSSADKRPNFIFILVDDLRWDALSCTGSPFSRTPNIDRLATGGMRFANAFVTTSLCAPSRASCLTGTYVHTNEVRTNEGEEYDHAMPTFPGLLQKAGYETAFIGKWHMKPTSDPRPGFDYWLSFKGQGVYLDPELNENGRKFKAMGYMTDLLTQYAVDFLKRDRSKPFSLCLWHKAVHGPFTPAQRHANLYKDVTMPEPVSFGDAMETKPAWQRKLAAGIKRPGVATRPAPASVPKQKWDPHSEARLDYFRTLAAVDDSVGRVLETLRETGALENTVIIFAGDNGFFQGEHRRGDKRFAFEESIRIPLLICGPGVAKAGSVASQMALNIDLAPTILDLAGVTPPSSMQGRPLRPLLANDVKDWRKSFLYEYYREEWLPHVPTMLGVRTSDFKYVRYPDIKDIDELYDLTKDAHEMRNLAVEPASAAKLKEMQAELDRLLRETGYRPRPPKTGA